MLAAGLEGMEKNYKLCAPANDNIYHMTEEGRLNTGIGSLPEDLLEAIKLTEESQIVKRALGIRLLNSLSATRSWNGMEYKAQVTQYELDKYLPIL